MNLFFQATPKACIWNVPDWAIQEGSNGISIRLFSHKTKKRWLYVWIDLKNCQRQNLNYFKLNRQTFLQCLFSVLESYPVCCVPLQCPDKCCPVCWGIISHKRGWNLCQQGYRELVLLFEKSTWFCFFTRKSIHNCKYKVKAHFHYEKVNHIHIVVPCKNRNVA